MFSLRPCPAGPRSVRYKFFPSFLPVFAEKVSIRYYPFADGRQFRNDVRYNAAVFLYSGVERNDTTNFREKNIY